MVEYSIGIGQLSDIPGSAHVKGRYLANAIAHEMGRYLANAIVSEKSK